MGESDFGIGSLVFGSLGVVIVLITIPLWYRLPINYEYFLLTMTLFIIAIILGANVVKKDASKGFGRGGLAIGVIGMIILVIFIGLLSYWYFWHTYIH